MNKGIKTPNFYPQRRRQSPHHRGQESQRKPYHQQFRRDVERFPQREYTPLNRARVYILDEILETGLNQLPPHKGKDHTLRGNLNAWCAYHRCKGHDTEKCFRLIDLIEELIKSGHLRKFLDDAANGKVVVLKNQRNPQRDQGGENQERRK
jgi:mRNA-degrading endonuclease YafQ of YafQ-DinJ toxin-antitoxin module